jgi:hypothetical protein
VPASAILVIGDSLADGYFSAPASSSPERPASFAGSPISCLEILGKSAAQRTIDHLAQGGISRVVILLDRECESLAAGPVGGNLKIQRVTKSDLAQSIQNTLLSLAQEGMDVALLLHAGSYAELDPQEFVQAFRVRQAAAVRFHDEHSFGNMWVLDVRRSAQAMTILEGSRRTPLEPLSTRPRSRGYLNRLSTPSDIRRFVLDMFYSRCAARPRGNQVRPGVWIDEGAEVHRQARIVPPAYIGRNTKIGVAALITRSSSVERECRVDYGTAIEDSSILAGTYVGAGLDVTHSVVCRSQLAHLGRNLVLDVEDEILVGTNAASPLFRAFRRTPGGRASKAGHHSPPQSFSQGKGVV